MPTVETLSHFTVKNLLAAVRKLPPSELHEFTRQFETWRAHTLESKETALIASIQENAGLPVTQQKRYEQLRHRCEQETLTEKELDEYRSLIKELEARNVKRIEALNNLAQLRGKTLRGIMVELGLQREYDAQ